MYFSDKYLHRLPSTVFLLLLLFFPLISLPSASAIGELVYSVTADDDFNALGIGISDRMLAVNVTPSSSFCTDTVAFYMKAQTVLVPFSIRYLFFDTRKLIDGDKPIAQTPTINATISSVATRFYNQTFNRTICLTAFESYWFAVNASSFDAINWVELHLDLGSPTEAGTVKFTNYIKTEAWAGDIRSFDIQIYNQTAPTDNYPQWTSLSPAQGSTFSNSTDALHFSVIASDDISLNRIDLYIDDILTNSTFPNTTSFTANFSKSFSSFTNGQHSWHFNITDSSAQENMTDIRTFSIVTIASDAGFSGFTCPNSSTTNVFMYALMLIVFIALIIIQEISLKIPLCGVVIGIGFMLILFPLIGCNLIAGAFLELFALLYIIYSIMH